MGKYRRMKPRHSSNISDPYRQYRQGMSDIQGSRPPRIRKNPVHRVTLNRYQRLRHILRIIPVKRCQRKCLVQLPGNQPQKYQPSQPFPPCHFHDIRRLQTQHPFPLPGSPDANADSGSRPRCQQNGKPSYHYQKTIIFHEQYAGNCYQPAQRQHNQIPCSHGHSHVPVFLGNPGHRDQSNAKRNDKQP